MKKRETPSFPVSVARRAGKDPSGEEIRHGKICDPRSASVYDTQPEKRGKKGGRGAPKARKRVLIFVRITEREVYGKKRKGPRNQTSSHPGASRLERRERR